jgi:hypothetical protein
LPVFPKIPVLRERAPQLQDYRIWPGVAWSKS